MGYKYDDNAIFIKVYDEYADAVFKYCSFRVFDRERAKEITQDVFVKTWEYAQKGNEIENIRAFLYKVAHNLCVNEVLRSRPFSLDEMSENGNFDPAEEEKVSPLNRAETALLMKKMQELDPGDRDILLMRYVEDLGVSEIAKILNILPNTASVKIKRAEETLKKLYR